MSNDELILQIIEKVHDQGKDTAKKVNELQIEQIRQGEMHYRNTADLQIHMARTEGNEQRIELLENELLAVKKEHLDLQKEHLKQQLLVSLTVKIVCGIAAVVGFFLKVLPYLSTLL